MSKQPLYPHQPKSKVSKSPTTRRNEGEPRIRFLPDSLEQIFQTVASTGYMDKLTGVFKDAIARARRTK